MKQILAVMALATLASCHSGADLAAQKRQTTDAHGRAWDALVNKMERLAGELAGGKDGADVIARAILSMSEREIREVVLCGVDRRMVGFSGSESKRQSALLEFRKAEDDAVRRDAADKAIAIIVLMRGDKSQGNGH